MQHHDSGPADKRDKYLLPVILGTWTIIALVASWRFLSEYFIPAGSLAGHTAQGNILGCDFVNIWTSARAVIEGRDLTQLYYLDDFMAVMNEYLGPNFPGHNWGYPPPLLLVTFFLGALPYYWAFAVWSIVGLGAFLAVCRDNGARMLDAPTLALLALSPACLFNLINGQNGFLTAALYLGGFFMLERKEKTAGVMFGLLTFKPHLGLLVPLVLIILKKWEAFATAALTFFALFLATTLIWGPGPWVAYLTYTSQFQMLLLQVDWIELRQLFIYMMPGVYADLHTALPYAAAMAVHVPFAVLSAVAALFIVWREKITPRSVLALTLAAVLVPPYAFNYDLTVVTGALMVYLVTRPSLPRARLLTFWGALWALPISVFWLKEAAMPMPVSSAILLGGLACLLCDSVREHKKSQ